MSLPLLPITLSPYPTVSLGYLSGDPAEQERH